MTGYGRGEAARDGVRFTVELSAVNRKQAEIAVALPRDLDVLEPQVRAAVQAQVSRGRVNVRITRRMDDDRTAAQVRVNRALAEAYVKELSRLAHDLGLEGGVTLDHLVRAPGVLASEEVEGDAAAAWPLIEEAVRAALAGLVAMRGHEGAHLAADLLARVAELRRAAAAVRARAPLVMERYRAQLLERLVAAGVALAPEDQERVFKELVIFADRSDITEELTRLESHCAQFQATLKSSEAAGRTLDFLAQEMNREINTIGAKANDLEITRAVVDLKTGLEKIREQVQNLE